MRAGDPAGYSFQHQQFQEWYASHFVERLILACAIGVVTMRELSETETFTFFKRLQRAFYAESIDITEPSVYPALLNGFSVDADEFTALLGSDEMKKEAWKDFEEARRLSINGFPGLLLRLGDEHLIVTRGYLPWETLEPALTGWMRETFGSEADDLIVADSTAPTA